MVRSKFKSPIFKNKFLDKNSPKNIKNKIIGPNDFGKSYNIYNGKGIINLKIVENMVGKKFGEFLLTRKYANHKKKK